MATLDEDSADVELNVLVEWTKTGKISKLRWCAFWNECERANEFVDRYVGRWERAKCFGCMNIYIFSHLLTLWIVSLMRLMLIATSRCSKHIHLFQWSGSVNTGFFFWFFFPSSHSLCLYSCITWWCLCFSRGSFFRFFFSSPHFY